MKGIKKNMVATLLAADCFWQIMYNYLDRTSRLSVSTILSMKNIISSLMKVTGMVTDLLKYWFDVRSPDQTYAVASLKKMKAKLYSNWRRYCLHLLGISDYSSISLALSLSLKSFFLSLCLALKLSLTITFPG